MRCQKTLVISTYMRKITSALLHMTKCNTHIPKIEGILQFRFNPGAQM